MIKIEKFQVNPIEENCYVVSDESNECCIIDCGAIEEYEIDKIAQYISDNNLKPVHLLATHGHVDHNWGNVAMEQLYGLKVEVFERDEDLILNMEEQEKSIFGRKMTDFPTPSIGKLLTEQDKILFGSHEFSIISTPGHSPGSCFFVCEEEKIAFSGDTLFKGSIGRTDFMGGNKFMIIMSLRQICQLPDDIKVYPGHGPETTIGYECATNMYLDR